MLSETAGDRAIQRARPLVAPLGHKHARRAVPAVPRQGRNRPRGSCLAMPHVARTTLPTPDILIVQDRTGHILILADHRVPQHDVDAAVRDLDKIMKGRRYALD